MNVILVKTKDTCGDNDNNYLTKEECIASGIETQPSSTTDFTRNDWPRGCVFIGGTLYFNAATSHSSTIQPIMQRLQTVSFGIAVVDST